jgi:hypothetical protein
MDPFALLKRWSLGTYLRRQHIDSYLNEFVFRYNRRFYRHVSFETVLGLATRHGPVAYHHRAEKPSQSFPDNQATATPSQDSQRISSGRCAHLKRGRSVIRR